MSDGDLELNNKLKQEEIEKLHLAGGENSDAAAMGDSNESLNKNKKPLPKDPIKLSTKKKVVKKPQKEDDDVDDEAE